MTKRAAWATDTAVERLREMWADLTIPASEIGRRLGVSKNAIVGKAQLLGLDPRPSPIIHTPERLSPTSSGPHIQAVPKGVATLPVLSALDALPIASEPACVPSAPLVPIPAAPRPSSAKASEGCALRSLGEAGRSLGEAGSRRTEPCCWVTVMSTKGRLPVYCNDDSMPGLPYCPRHAGDAYPAIKRQQRAENGAGNREDA